MCNHITVMWQDVSREPPWTRNVLHALWYAKSQPECDSLPNDARPTPTFVID